MIGSPDHALAHGQPGGGPIPGGPSGGAAGPNQAGQEEKDGPAEEAPKDKQALRPVQAIVAQPVGRRRLQLFEAHGYLRTRMDYFHRLDLGINQPASNGDPGTKFFPPPEKAPVGEAGNDANCVARLKEKGVSAQKITKRCERRNGISSANMRFRVSPTLHISETVKIHATVDALDNLVLGSTPDSFAGDHAWAPIDLYTRTQVPPSDGNNAFQDSLVVKRVYGHIHFGWGFDLKFGRMPHQWGMGIVANDGNGYDRQERADIVRSLDADYGDSIDSLRMGFDLGEDPRRLHRLTFSWDWASSGPTTAQVLGPEWASGSRVGQEYSLEKFDNVYQVSVSMLRRDDPAMLRRKLSSGEPVINYGAIAWMRMQDVDRPIGAPGLGDGLGGNPTAESDLNPDGFTKNGATLGNGEQDAEGRTGLQNYAQHLMYRRAMIVTPDVWMRVNWRTLRVEFEAAAVLGYFSHRDLSIGPANLDTLTIGELERSTLSQAGYALEFKYGMFDDRFHVGLDQGFATGDRQPPRNYDPMSPLPNSYEASGDTNLTAFRFNPAYVGDMLLFRELLGTASNAVYFKPWLAFYTFQDNASLRVDIEYAFAQHKSATPGASARSYGLEINGAVRYHDTRDPIFVQLQYGVMFPFGAFDVPSASGTNVDAEAAQSLQIQMGIGF